MTHHVASMATQPFNKILEQSSLILSLYLPPNLSLQCLECVSPGTDNEPHKVYLRMLILWDPDLLVEADDGRAEVKV